MGLGPTLQGGMNGSIMGVASCKFSFWKYSSCLCHNWYTQQY